MILVSGATGYLGGIIVRTLLTQGCKLRALVRVDSDYSAIADAGAECVLGDLKDDESLRRACEGVESIVTTANSAQRGGNDNAETVDLKGNHKLIDAARDAGVRQFVFVSAYGASTSHPVPFLQAKARTEEYLRSSGLSYTILSPHIFMDVWIPIVVGSALQEQRPVVLLGQGERKHSFIAVTDVAAFAVGSVGNDRALNQQLVLGGPEAVSWRDIIVMTEKAVGRPIAVQTTSAGAAVPPLPEFILGLLAGMEMGDVIIPMEETASAFGVVLTSPEQFVRRAFGR